LESPAGIDFSYSFVSDGSTQRSFFFSDPGIQVSEEDDHVVSWDDREDVVELAVVCFLDFIFRVEGGNVGFENGWCRPFISWIRSHEAHVR